MTEVQVVRLADVGVAVTLETYTHTDGEAQIDALTGYTASSTRPDASFERAAPAS